MSLFSFQLCNSVDVSTRIRQTPKSIIDDFQKWVLRLDWLAFAIVFDQCFAIIHMRKNLLQKVLSIHVGYHFWQLVRVCHDSNRSQP